MISMTHDIKSNKYDIEVIDEKLLDNKHIIKVRTYINGDKKIKQFNFSHAQTPGGKLESWKKHIKQWIERLEKENEVSKLTENKDKGKFNVD